MTLLKYIKEYMPLICTIITVFVTVTIYRRTYYKQISRERLEKIYQPLYEKMEPILFRYNYQDPFFLMIMTEAYDFVKKNRLLAGNKIYADFKTFFDTESDRERKKYFLLISEQIIYKYNMFCSDCGLEKISITYQHDNKLYSGAKFPIKYIWFNIKIVLVSIFISFMLIMILTIFVYQLYLLIFK